MNLHPFLQTPWARLAPREQTGVLLATGLVSLALLWWVLLAPALQVWRSAEAQTRNLDAQLQTMQSLQTQAKALQAQPRLGTDESLRALQTSTQQYLGNAAQLNVNGERATITLKNAPAQALAQWLTQTRINARLAPSEAHLSRSANGSANWDGTLTLVLPTR
jgi:general secretion pathway protein M